MFRLIYLGRAMRIILRCSSGSRSVKQTIQTPTYCIMELLLFNTDRRTTFDPIFIKSAFQTSDFLYSRKTSSLGNRIFDLTLTIPPGFFSSLLYHISLCFHTYLSTAPGGDLCRKAEAPTEAGADTAATYEAGPQTVRAAVKTARRLTEPRYRS